MAGTGRNGSVPAAKSVRPVATLGSVAWFLLGELMDFIGVFSGGFPATNCFGFCFELRLLTWLVVILKQKQVLENPQKWISLNKTLIHSVFNYTQLIDNMMVKIDKMKMDDDMMDGKLKMTADKMNGKMMVQTVVMMKYDGEKMDEPRTPQRPLLLSLPPYAMEHNILSLHPPPLGFSIVKKSRLFHRALARLIGGIGVSG